MIRFFFSALLCLSLFACSSTGGAGADSGADESRAAKLSLYDYRTGTTLSIVNDAYITRLGVAGDTSALRRVAFYSQKHANQSTKVTEDRYLLATIDQLEKEGFARWSSQGQAPRDSLTASSSIEIELPSGTRYFLRHSGMQVNQARDHLACSQLAWEVFNFLEQYQSVNPEDFHFERMPVRGAGRD